ncbi:hypothetical protein H920_00855 [Fukomys damarensis]|uniref:Uncharacterized protein n=1 Tax=Fukomys damarensis TaxID=885580 RepID=A0A091E4R9_FUKDA|nr:hypothetical protein H920_00855 [Fukomys damarensis]
MKYIEMELKKRKGIVEHEEQKVDLGISAKIKNTISTEDATARLLAEQQNKKKDSEMSFVPTSMAVNYVQHNRCYHKELNAPIPRNKEEPKARPLPVGDTVKPDRSGPHLTTSDHLMRKRLATTTRRSSR